MFNNKKGNIDDPVEALLIIFGFVMVFFVMWTIMDGFNTRVSTLDVTNSSNVTMNFIDTYQEKYTSGYDFGALFLIIMLPIFSFVAAKLIPTRPVYMILFFFVVGFIILSALIMSNMYGAMLDNVKFSTFTSNLTYIPFIMPNLPYWVMIYLAVIVYALYTKSPS